MNRPILGLALGGGAVRGLAHLGVLRALERSALFPDVICGTSSGAIIAGAIASGSSPGDLIETALELRWNELVRPSVRRDRLFDTSGLDDFIASLIPMRTFDELSCSFASVAQDRRTGERVVLSRGNPARAAAASSAIRRAFPPVHIDGRQLVDGIDVDPVPVGATRQLGATFVVAIDVLRVNAVRRVRTKMNCCERRDPDTADLTITPALGSRSAWNFSLASEMIELGDAAGESAAVAIERALETA